MTDSEELQKAKDHAWRLLGIRDRSRKELREGLLRKRKYSEETVNEVIARLEELGYLNDRKFAQDFVEYRRQQGKGPELIKAELRRKGVEPGIIREVAGEKLVYSENDFDRLKTIAEQKMKQMKELPPRKAAQRITGYLARKGFGLDMISRVLRAVRIDIECEEEHSEETEE